ncbi:glycine cleavage system aminomethyltransferase GcvT [Ornithinibacillus halotolerans]|uniref:Aminomethyltransferase n=1 Tax=Ornithinibacillus halotolerans TaxID=1274357 RepID=A0A916W5H2_9BACI|nr:glycine cleavage system aminomethyltransferase GcvT [Ornithinibacillus halotolerans]GGA68266.1 aminomethyltransferase [Ornithinibacillus halotolerans]
MSELKRTPIYSEYEKYGAKTIDFGGWDLPVQFSSIKEEHVATRTTAGLFDVSHMGEILVTGPKSLEYLQYVTTNDVSKLVPNKAQYAFMCYEDGGTVDDFLIYMLRENEYLLVVNAANTDKDFEWMIKNNQYAAEEVTIQNVSANYAQVALQGPKAEEILQTMTETDLSAITFFRFDQEVYLSGIEKPALVSRTGYTGEGGFEIYIDAEAGPVLWNRILEAGKEKGLLPVGLGARDTLRFEANLPLYGQELSQSITPIEAGLGFAVKVNKKENFIGKEVLKEQVENGTSRKIVGIEMIDKGIPRHGYEVLYGDEEIGVVTSGTQSPTLQKNIGLAIIKSEYATLDNELTIQVRKRKLRAKVIPRTFLKQD